MTRHSLALLRQPQTVVRRDAPDRAARRARGVALLDHFTSRYGKIEGTDATTMSDQDLRDFLRNA